MEHFQADQSGERLRGYLPDGVLRDVELAKVAQIAQLLGQRGELVLGQVELGERLQAADLYGHGHDLVVGELECEERRKKSHSGRQARQLVARSVQSLLVCHERKELANEKRGRKKKGKDRKVCTSKEESLPISLGSSVNLLFCTSRIFKHVKSGKNYAARIAQRQWSGAKRSVAKTESRCVLLMVGGSASNRF